MPYLKIPRTTQPQTPVAINRTSAFSQGLVAAVSGASPQARASSVAHLAKPAGIGAYATSTSSGGLVLPPTVVGTSGTILVYGYTQTGASNGYWFDGETATDRDLFAFIGSTGVHIWYVANTAIADGAGSIDAGLFDSSLPTAVVLRWRNGAQSAWKNGALFKSWAMALSVSSLRSIRLHSRFSSNEGNATGPLLLFAQWDRELSDSEIVALSRNPWQLFEPRRILIPVSVAAGVTGTFAVTETNDTSTASGTTTVVGSFARTETNDTSSASGTTTIVGTLTRTTADDTLSATATTTITGTFARSSTSDTMSASGTTTVVGTLTKTTVNDSITAPGTTTITGTFTITDSVDILAANGVSGTPTATSSKLPLSYVGQ